MADTLSFHAASHHSDAELAALFNRGYAGYYAPVTLDAAAFRGMVDANQIDLDASRIGERGDEPVAFAMLGIRGARGWIGGMGVAPEARGRGFGRAAMEAVLESARARSLEHVDLEVLEQNTPAARIYEALGFRDWRKVEVFARAPAPLPPETDPAAEVVSLGVRECLDRHARYHPERPPWQRDLPALEHWADRLHALGVRDGTEIGGWVLYRPDGARLNLADLALAARRPAALLVATLRALIGAHPDSTLTLVNLPADDPAGNCLLALGATVKFRQREMTLAL
jgi:ribosomal protein S18 acetylase RimI-like enzyme